MAARVLITGRSHLHRGETGVLAVGRPPVHPAGGEPMVRVVLDEPHLGVSRCHATATELIPVTHSYNGGGGDA